MASHRIDQTLYRLQVHLGLTRSEFRGFLAFLGLLGAGILAREAVHRVPAIDPATYVRLEEEFRIRSRDWATEEAAGPPMWVPAPLDSISPVPALPTTELLDLNVATSDQLQDLPGIGPALAGRILDHRNRFGAFLTVDDLILVSGIGPATMARLRLLVIASPPASHLHPCDSPRPAVPPRSTDC